MAEPLLPPDASSLDQQPEISGEDYWSLARQPLYSLIYLAPILIGYEYAIHTFSLTPATTTRNGVDFLFRQFLESCGCSVPFLLPGIVALILIVWHFAAVRRTTFHPHVFIGMTAESLMFACILIVLGQIQDFVFQEYIYRPTLSVGNDPGFDFGNKLVTFTGAGLYEEVLFRLTLLPLAWGFFRALALPGNFASFFAIVFSSAAFAAIHHLAPNPDPFSTFTFSFRMVAGLYLAGLFFRRGFGVTAGCHIAYDVLVGVIMQTRC